jgi:hypothetical protein
MPTIGELLKERNSAKARKDFELVKKIDIMMEDRVFDAMDIRMEINRHQQNVGWGAKR